MFHNRITAALSEGSTWAAIAASLGTTATQLPAPYSYCAYGLAGLAAIAGIILRDKGA